MSYPPPARVVTDLGAAISLMCAHPFAHLFTAHGGLETTRVPFIADVEDGQPVRLRAHVNAQNPQGRDLDGAQVLVVFSGPSTYVSPHWRAAPTRAGTYDYEEVKVRGRVRVVNDFSYFTKLIDDISSLVEPQYREVGDYPVWQTSMAPSGYIERLFPQVTSFDVVIESIATVSKLHQQFPSADRIAIVEHLSRANRDDARAIAAKMSRLVEA